MFLCLLGTKHHCWTEILSFCFMAVAGFIVTSRGTKIKITAGFYLLWEEKKKKHFKIPHKRIVDLQYR